MFAAQTLRNKCLNGISVPSFLSATKKYGTYFLYLVISSNRRHAVPYQTKCVEKSLPAGQRQECCIERTPTYFFTAFKNDVGVKKRLKSQDFSTALHSARNDKEKRMTICGNISHRQRRYISIHPKIYVLRRPCPYTPQPSLN
jgi:hypothetical protein